MAKTTSNPPSLWEMVCTTDPSFTKNVKLGGRTFTTVQAQYQIKMATDVFGSFGIGFGITDRELREVSLGNGYMIAIYTATLWYDYDGKRGILPIESSINITSFTRDGSFRVDDEYVKKVTTDALTKGLSKLGFNADVFLGMFDDSRYVEHLIHAKAAETANVQAQTSPQSGTGLENVYSTALKLIEGIKTREELIAASDYVQANFSALTPQEASKLEGLYNIATNRVKEREDFVIDLTQEPSNPPY